MKKAAKERKRLSKIVSAWIDVLADTEVDARNRAEIQSMVDQQQEIIFSGLIKARDWKAQKRGLALIVRLHRAVQSIGL